MSRDELASILAANSKRLHGLLRDQREIAGLGRMLANEICYEAALSPFANASKLTDAEVDRLHETIATVVARATDHERRSTTSARASIAPPRSTTVPASRASTATTRSAPFEYRRTTVYYCPTRQTGGKLSADNTTSKFLK